MRRFLANIVSVLYTLPRLVLLKAIYNKGVVFGCIERISPNVVIDVARKSKLVLGKRVRVHSGCKLKARPGAALKIGDDVRVNYNCMFVAHRAITVKSGAQIGPNVLVYDHDHDYRSGLRTGKFRAAPVVIGEHVWIGANTTILKGVTIGDRSVVAAGSLITGDIPADSVVYQKRDTTVVGQRG